MQVYVLLSFINNEVKTHYVGYNICQMKRKLTEHAQKYVIDEVGRNNFVDTLEDNKEVSSYATGYVLKYDTEDNTRINVYKNNEVVIGRLWSSKHINTTTIGYFKITESSDFDLSTGVTHTSSAIHIKSHVNNDSTRMRYANVINEILEYQRKKMSKVDIETVADEFQVVNCPAPPPSPPFEYWKIGIPYPPPPPPI
jgi:hypothetical protein